MMTSNQAIQALVRQAFQGELVFPANMATSLQLQRALDDPDCHLATIADRVVAEPLIAARVVAIANSVAFTRFGGRVESVRTAILQLGLLPLRALVALIVVRQIAEQITDPALKERADVLWRHCAQVAALAKVLAREFTNLDPEAALFTGIVHEIDGFYLLSRAARQKDLLTEEIDNPSRVTLSAGVLQALKVPKMVADAVIARFSAPLTLPPKSLADILILANRLAKSPSPLADGGDQVVGTEIDFAMGEKTLRNVLDDRAGEIAALADSLLA